MSTANTSGASIGNTIRAAERRASRRAALAAFGGLALLSARGSAQERAPASVRVVAPDSAPTAALLRTALSARVALRTSDSAHVVALPRGARIDSGVVVLGGPATVASTVDGDVIVVGGDLFVHPGAHIEGRAVAIGGGVYPSSLATIDGGIAAFRGHTYNVTRREGTLTLTYRPLAAPQVTAELPLLGGVRIPSYDRVDGLSLSWGPELRVGSRAEIEPLLTYRSDLGDVDPFVAATVNVGTRDTLRIGVGRETTTNDRWIKSDLVNSLVTLWSGNDERNYYRRDVASMRVARGWTGETFDASLSLGALLERDWSTGGDSLTRSAPWSFYGREDIEEGIRRPNPPVSRGSIGSGVIAARANLQLEDVRALGSLAVEVPWTAPAGERFAQLTADVRITFPTFGAQSLTTWAHAVVTGPDTAPAQRFSYLGGSTTLPTIEPTLAFGGDQLFYLQTRYDIPNTAVQLPVVGSPTVAIVNMVGAAGVHRLPSFTDNIGVGLSLSYLRLYGVIDPASHRRVLSFGLSVIQ
jgi:hypothetical protein